MPDTAFDPQPVLTGPTLLLRPLGTADREGLAAAASDPATWAGHPSKDRYKREAFDPYFDLLVGTGTALAVVDRATDTIIGCSRYYVPPGQPEGLAIGFTFLDNRFWGGTTNFELKRLMLEHAFALFPEVWFHIGPSNIRSQKATAKLGAEHAYDATLDLAGTPTSWMCFRLTEAAWRRAMATKAN